MSDATLRDEYDVAVVGAGPAGMAAASLCARHGLATVNFDEQLAPGGQIYRPITESALTDPAILGPDLRAGQKLAHELAASGAQYVPRATVLSLTRERAMGVSCGGRMHHLRARRVILATGALERPFPIPGWTLPGVMTAGAAQALLKSSGLVADGRVVLAGTGPLLWLLARQYLAVGAKVDLILDTTPRENRRRAWPHAAGFLFSPYFRPAVALLRALRGNVRVVKHVTALRAQGDSKLQSVAYRVDGGAEVSVAADTLLLHQGVVPNVILAMSAGVEHRWDDAQLCWSPLLDAEGTTTLPGIAIAGDGAGIAGGQAAAWRGVLIGMAAVRALAPATKLPVERLAVTALRHYLRGRRFLDRYYRPADAFRMPEGDTIVCRCEEVRAREVIDAALGIAGRGSVNDVTRCGLGPCEGRLCALTVTELIARARQVTPQEAGYPHRAEGHAKRRPA